MPFFHVPHPFVCVVLTSVSDLASFLTAIRDMSAEEINEATAEFCDPRGTLRGEFGQWIDSLEGTSETWEPYAMLMAAAGQAALLHFFSDARHTSIQEPIAADGSNIQHTTLLKDTFQWYAEWLTLLHQTKFLKIAKDDKAIIRRLWVDEKDWDGLVAHIPKIDSSRINEMKELGKKLYDTPVVDLVQSLQSRPELDWVREWREEILRCLMEMQNAAARLPENHLDRDAAVRSVS
ncbi:hypothetical protein B0J12DRAFT_3956 [Macrophomina phaseolina]|uniref:Uncharacterized protein n=1 Tax=Macrophomina phaseolina TaxID=35725 RepID=A0ABQ8GTK2_9PEZI|nr:hypothetical protein B0J12DRAFT_3956 [Macrophomina phaseolina]